MFCFQTAVWKRDKKCIRWAGFLLYSAYSVYVKVFSHSFKIAHNNHVPLSLGQNAWRQLFFTVITYRRQPLLIHPESRKILREVIQRVQQT